MALTLQKRRLDREFATVEKRSEKKDQPAARGRLVAVNIVGLSIHIKIRAKGQPVDEPIILWGCINDIR
jgi:hypothetical protein